MDWRLAKNLDLPNFDPVGISRARKFKKNENYENILLSENIAISSQNIIPEEMKRTYFMHFTTMYS